MEEFDASDGNIAEALAKEFAKEKNDIVCGFLKEKEIIEMMHKEEVNGLFEKFEQEKEYMRNEFELEKEDLLKRFQAQQVEKINEFQREQDKMEGKQAKDRESIERTVEMKYKKGNLKMRRQYEEVIAEKNEEIKMLRRELLRVQHEGGDLSRSSPDIDIYIKRTEHDDELRRIRNDFEIEKLELDRKCDREKAELVQVFANQAERMNANYDQEKQRIQQDHQKELDFKLDATERLLSEKADIERKRMIQQFEREITELHESLEIGFKERLLEKQEAIDDLEKEKKELLNALQTERFSLAQLYNREVSLLTNPDQVTKEDVEVALIDEIAKLKKEHDDVLTEMEGQHKQKIEVIKRGQQPVKELERKHRKEIEKMRKDFENEKESLEAEFRNEQFNLLKSFEFEKNDMEQRYEEIINEKELEIQHREDEMRRMYEGDIEELKSIVEKQREELEISKQKLGDLAGEMEEFASEKNRIEEKFHKENNQCQNLEQTIEKNLRAFEKNLKEAERLHHKELAKKDEEFAREKDRLKEQVENEKLDLQREIETLKSRLDEFQMASENEIVATSSENILESGLVVNNAAAEKRGSAIEGKESQTLQGDKSPLEELKGEKESLDEKDGVNEPLENTEGEDKQVSQGNTDQDVDDFLGKIRETLNKCIRDEDKNDTLEDPHVSNKRMKDTINQAIKQIEKFCSSKDEHDMISLEDEPTFTLEDQILALENILKEGDSDVKSDKLRKDQINEKVKDILKDAHRCHEVEKLKLNKEHQEEINALMKEVADEKKARVRDSLETLKRLQELDPSGDCSLNSVALKTTEEKCTSTSDLDNTKDESSPKRTKRDGKESDPNTPSEIVEELRREKEEMKRSIDELETSFTKEKENLMEKLQTQHKEFVMSTEGEIIENLLKQKSTLEEAFNLERFYLSRLYYLEMKDELEDILSRKAEKMKKDFDRDKMEIVLKYESEIADLHNLLSEKGEMELRLLQDRNETMGKLLASQNRKRSEKGEAEDMQNEKERLEREKEKIEVTIPLKKELAELQNKRHQEHETAVANLKEAVDLLKDIMSNPPSRHQDDDQETDRYSFVSEDPVRSIVNSPQNKASEKNLKSGKRLLLSEDEIRNKVDLKSALENLVELVLNDDEDSVYDSETTSGASSDLESEASGPATVNGESDEGAYSGPESTDGDMLHIKKAELDFTFNLERFNLGRVYYGEYRDSLRKAMKKLAKAKDSLRNKRKDLENDLLSGIKNLVDRTRFGRESIQAPGAEDGVITDGEDGPTYGADGKQLTETEMEDNKTTSASGNEEVLGDSNGHIESKQEEEKEGCTISDNLDHDHLLIGDNGSEDGSAEIVAKPWEKRTLDEKANQDHPSENDAEGAITVDKSKTDRGTQSEKGLLEEKAEHLGETDKESGFPRGKSDGKRAIEQKENISLTEGDKTQQDNTGEDQDSDSEPTSKDASIEKLHDKNDTVFMEDGGVASPGKKDKQYFDALQSADEDDLSEKDYSPDKKLEAEPKVKDRSTEKIPIKDHAKAKEDKEESSWGDKDNTEPLVENRILPDNGSVGDKKREPELKGSDSSDGMPVNLSSEGPTKHGGETLPRKDDSEEDCIKTEDTTEDVLMEVGDVDTSHGLNSATEMKGKDSAFEKPVTQELVRSTGGERETSEGNEDVEKARDGEQAERDDILTEEESKTAVDGGEDEAGLYSDNTENEDEQKEHQPANEKEAQKLMDGENRVSKDQEGERRDNTKSEDRNDSKEKQEDQPLSTDGNEPLDEPPKKDEILKSDDKEDACEKTGDENISVSDGDVPEYDELSDKSDALSQAVDDDNENPRYQESPYPVDDQDLIKQLNRNNKALQDKFNLLCELVGKSFVNEIPELRDEKGQEGNVIALDALNDLYTEKEQLTDELKQDDSRIKELTATGNDERKDLMKRLDDEEMQLLQSLGEIDKQLKRNDDKELVEHLLKEKENICTKLDEINNLLNEQKEAMAELGSKDSHTVPGLMCKVDVLKDDLCEKERQLSYKTKMLDEGTNAAAKEKENLRNALNSLNAQLAALEDGMQETDANAYPYGRKKINEELPAEVASLVKCKADADNEKKKLEKEITKTENDIGRYSRILEEQRKRLKPFQRKRARIQESLDWVNSMQCSEGETLRQSEDKEDVEEPVDNETETPLAEETKYLDRDEATGEKQSEIENKIVELDLEISKLELPCELEQKIPGEMPTADKIGIVNRVKLRTEEDLKGLEEKLVAEQNKLKEVGFSDSIDVARHLEEKEYLKKEIAKLENYQSPEDDFMDDANLPLGKELKNLLVQKQGLEEKVQKLDGEISDEQHNFLDARHFKSTGNVNEESESNIKGLIDIKAKLVANLQDTNQTILQSLSTGSLKGPQTEFIEECVERKVKLEDEIDKLEDKIDDETLRAAEMLGDLLEQKSVAIEELRSTSNRSTEEAKTLQENVSCSGNGTEEISELINRALREPGTTAAIVQERIELQKKQREIEDIVNEKAERLREAKRQKQDPNEVEKALENVIREKIPVDKRLQEIHDEENDSNAPILQLPSASREHTERLAEARQLDSESSDEKDTDEALKENASLHISRQDAVGDENDKSEVLAKLRTKHVAEEDLDEKRRELKKRLSEIEDHLSEMLQIPGPSGTSSELQKDDLQELGALVGKKVKLEDDLEQIKLLEDLLNKKETLLQEDLSGKDEGKKGFAVKTQLENELRKLNELIDRRENEIRDMETKQENKKEVLDQLISKNENLDEKLEPLKENIVKVKENLKASLEEIQTNITGQEERSGDEEQSLQKELEKLQNEIESCNKDLKEADKELNRLKKESRQQKDTIPGDVLSLEKLLVEKENLREYLAEIDQTLDNSQTDVRDQPNPAKIEELRKQKKELENKLEEIRDEKAKWDVEFEDDEMDEVLKELAQRKEELEERKRDIGDQIRSSGVIGKLAEKRRKRESKMPRYYLQGILDEMARDEKTLTELIKEQEDLKAATQRQSELLENELGLLKSKVGEDLVSAISMDPDQEIQLHRGSEYQAGIDEVQGNKATISDVLNDLTSENKELIEMNSELSADLETLKEKIGEDLVQALLSENAPNKDLEFEDVISAVQEEEDTLASILHKQKEEKHLIEDMVGSDLLTSMLRTEDALDLGHHTDSTLQLVAPAIMKTYDEDLENVIAVYEKELDNLSRENDLLKEKLGKDLSRALLQMGKSSETPVRIDNKEKDSPPIMEDEKTGLDETLFGGRPTSSTIGNDSRSIPTSEGRTLYSKEGLDNDDDILTGGANIGSDARGKAKKSLDSFVGPKPDRVERKEPEKQQDTETSIEQPISEDMDQLSDRDTLPEQESISTDKQPGIEPRIYNIVGPHFGSPAEKKPPEFTDEEIGRVEGTLNAPIIMRDNDYTLEEVIAQYENDLGTHVRNTPKRRTVRRYDRLENPEDISKVDETMQGIVDAQAKNMEMLRVLKDRLGEDLVNALINETEKDHLDDLINDVKHPKTEDLVDSKADDQLKFKERSLAAHENEPAEEQTSTEVAETTDSSVDMVPREKPEIVMDDKEDAMQRHRCKEDPINRRTLKAPSIALEKNKTLADVIESYEVGLDSLRSKLGPSLTNTLLSMEDQTTVERHDDNKGMRRTPTQELKEVPSQEAQEDAEDGENGEEADRKGKTPTPEGTPEDEISTERETTPVKELRAPDIMAISGKTLEEVIEDYEERLNEELNSLEKEVSLLKEKLGNDLFHTLLAHPSIEEETSLTEEIKEQKCPKETDPESQDEASIVPDLKAKSLLQDDGKTVENILRKYERQLEELAKLVPNENDEGVSILDLTSNYEDKIADLEKENKMYEDRLAKLSEIIGPDLLQKLEDIADEQSSETEEAAESVKEDIKAPIAMQKEDKSLEEVLRDYEKELNLLRKMLPSQRQEGISIADIIKDYEGKVEDLKGEHDRLVSRIGSNLVDDILKLTLPDYASNGDIVKSSDGNVSTQPETSTFNVASGLNAPEVMKRDDSTLENVLEIYEKALGLLSRPPVPQEDSFVDSKMHTFEDLKRENEILKDALGDSLANNLLKIADNAMPPISEETVKRTKTEELNPQSKDKTKIASDTAEALRQPSEENLDDGMSVYSEGNKLEAVELVKDEGRTIENILKNYEKELEALRKLVPSETDDGVSVSELVKDYEDKIDKLENENKCLLDMLDDLKKNIGPELLNELQNLDNNNMEYDSKHLDGREPSGLQAPILMENESKTLEGVIKGYENELDALRKLIPDEGEEASSISDIIKDYGDKVEDLSKENKTLKDELRDLEKKIGVDLVNDLQNVAVEKVEETESTSDAGETSDSSFLKPKRTLKAPGIMNKTKLPLEDIVATYEQDLDKLKRENKVFEDGLGKGLAEALLTCAQDRNNNSSEKCETQGVDDTSKANKKKPDKPVDPSQDKVAAIRRAYSEYTKQPSQNDVQDEGRGDAKTSADELKATALLKEGGEDLEQILKNYEKELDALKKLTPGETEDGISISDLINNYENKIDTLENENKSLDQNLHNLRETIGEDLYDALDNLKSEETADDGKGDQEIDVDAINVMKNEDRSLGNIVKTYEKELIALRKLVPESEGESGSLSDIIKEYEDKVEELQRQNEDARNTLDQLEGKVGSNLFRDLKDGHVERDEKRSASDDVCLQEKVKESESREKAAAPEVNTGKELTLECLMASREKDIIDLTEENKALKDILGQELAETLLNIAGEKETSPLTDPDGQRQESKRQVSEEPTTSSLLKKGKGSRKKLVDKGRMEDLTKVYAQPLNNNTNDKQSAQTASPDGNLKAEAFVRDEGRTIEDILNNYEKELEALTKLVPDNNGISISELVKEYEDKIKSLENENDGLTIRLEDIKQKIGANLLGTVENREPEADPSVSGGSEQWDENKLMAPVIMQTEDRTLENVLNTYEKELVALRSIIPSEGQEGQSISDLVKAYEDKLEELRTENESVRKDSDRLVKRIGPNLVEDIQKLEEITSDVSEGVHQSEVEPDSERDKPVNDLKVTKIMDVKQSTLEEVLETYENSLGILLSDSPSSIDELSMEDLTNTIEDLKQENDILKSSVGASLSQRLLNIAKDDKDTPQPNLSDNQELAQSPEDEMVHYLDENVVTKVAEHPPQKGSPKEAINKSLSPSDELQAENLVKEEGRTIENILKNYEKELEALKSLVSKDSGQPVDAISNLVKKYEDKMDHLKKEKDNLANQIEFLERTIGTDLMNDLEYPNNLHAKDSEETLEVARKSELNAPGIMEEENRTLETVINCYEKELDALRKLAPNQEEGQQVAVSDIIKNYEDKLDELKEENNSLKNQYNALTDRLGRNLVNDIKNLDEDKVEEMDENANEEIKGARLEKPLKAPKIMRENDSTLENVLERYEDTLGFNPDSANEDADKEVTDDQLRCFKELQDENKIFKKTLGEKLSQDILEIAKVKELKKDLECDDSVQGEVDRHGSDETKVAQKRSSLDMESKDRKLFEIEVTSPSDELKANALIRDKGSTVESILKNYEKEIEALSKLVPNEADSGYSLSDLVQEYEGKIESLKAENCNLGNKLEHLTDKIGQDLVNDLESPVLEEERDGDDLEAPSRMQKEGRTLEKVVRNYEKELEALRKTVSDQGENPLAITDMVNEYQNKIEELKTENENLNNKLGCLKQRIGSNLLEDVMSMKNEVSEGNFKEDKESETCSEQAKLKAPKIMQEKKVTLEDVLESYETALSSDPGNGMMSKIHEDLDDKRIHNLELENKVFRDSLGDSFAQKLLGVSKMKDPFSSEQPDDSLSSTPPELSRETGPTESTERDDRPHTERSAGDLKATTLIIDKGQTIEDVLQMYERDLEALGRLDHEDTDTPTSDVADFKEIELLKEKVGLGLVNELLLLSKSDSGSKQSWKALETMMEEEKTLEHILENYERELERLKREKSAMEALVNDNESDGQSALDIISQYEDEIEHLKDKNKDHETKLSVLLARMGDNLVNDVLSINDNQARPNRSALNAIEIMEQQEKQLSAILEQYESDISKLTRENEMLNSIASKETVDRKPLTNVVSEYEGKIQDLLDEKQKIETNLMLLSEKVGESLANELLHPGENEEISLPLDAVNIMEKEGKTLAEVTKEYENELARNKREINALQEVVSEDSEKSAFMDRISKYEDEIADLNEKLNDLALLERKVGMDLSRQLTALHINKSAREENVTLKAVERMEKDKDIALADVIKDYEEELEKKEHEILTLKELVSGDILEIATSQESEIDELKKVKAILANELDYISNKVGKDLTNEIMKRSSQQTEAEIIMFYQKIFERMDAEEKPLSGILEDYDKEIKMLHSENKELSNKEDTLTKLSEKIGKDLLDKLLKEDLSDSSTTGVSHLFKAPQMMSMEEKTLGEVIIDYENELEKLKRENEALRMLTESGGSQESSVLDVLSNYEEKIETLNEENRELNKRWQMLTQRVGIELSDELLKLPDDVEKSSAEHINELEALKKLEENRTTLAHVLQEYEKKLKESKEADLGPLVSGQAITEDVKYAHLVHVTEGEPKLDIFEKEPLEKSSYPQKDETDGIKTRALYQPADSKEISLEDQQQIKKHSDVNAALHNNLEQLSRKVGRELAEELMRPSEDEHKEVKPEATFASVRDLDAFADLVAERATVAQVLENYQKQLKRTLQDDKGDVVGPLVKSRIVKDDIKCAQLLRASEYEPTASTIPSDQLLVEEGICDFIEGEDINHYTLPNVDSNLAQNEEKMVTSDTNAAVNETDEHIDLSDLDLRALGDLVLKEPQIMEHPDESLLLCQDRELVQEDIIRVERPVRHEEHFNLEYMEDLFGSEIPAVETGDHCDETDSTWAERYLHEKAPETSEHDKYELDGLKSKVKELENELKEERNLKEKYEKDVQDLLQDIVELKMKQAEDDDEVTPEEIRQRIQEEVEIKQENKRLQEDLRKEKKRRLSIEESKRDLIDEVDSLMREKETLLKQQNGAKDNNKLLEELIYLRKKLGEVDTENKHLHKEVEDLKEALSEVVVNHDDEKEKSEMTEELIASKSELESQLQELLGMNDDLKGTIKNLQEELRESSEKVTTEEEVQNENQRTDAEINNNEEEDLLQKLGQLELEAKEFERKLLYEKEKNEKLKEQLDETEDTLRQTLTKYQDEIKSIETEKTKQEDEMRSEIEIMANKLQLEKETAEEQQRDFQNLVQREKERLKEDIETEHEREKKKLHNVYEDKEEELSRQEKRRTAQLQDQEEQWKNEREELQAIFRSEKEKLQKAFDEELNRKILENDAQHKQRDEEMSRKFAKEKKEIKATIEKKIYEQLLDKNISAESDFQEVLSKILQEHAKEIEAVENNIRTAEERFKEDKNKFIEQSDTEKEALKKIHQDEKKALESAVQNLLKEVVKLKHQRKEIRMIHKKEKESMEEIYERDRIKLKEDWEQYKRDLLSKLQEESDNKLANETAKLETMLEDLKQQLEKSEKRRKELEERLKGNAVESEHVRSYEEAKVEKDEAHSKELMSVKKSLEEEYDKKLKEEKRKFEETLQGLRREIGNLQEKRKLIQDKIYNQDPSLVDRNVIEKSIANYKMEMLSKMEEEATQKIAREKKPLEETIKEQQLEIDDLKRQRWELRNQIRRERSKQEEEFELERERMENQFLKEREELKRKLESRLQREMTKRAMEDKVSRALSPISNELPYSPQDSPRRIISENMSLRDDNQRLELEVRQLTSKLEAMESSFEGIMSSEKVKFEKMKRIQENMPRKVTFSDEVETRMMDYTASDPNETVLQQLRERDNQVRQLLDQKRFYEEVLSELCEEAGLFELDQNVVI